MMIKKLKKQAILAFLCFSAFSVYAVQTDTTENNISSLNPSNNIDLEQGEKDFQDEIEDLFPQKLENIDTTLWCTTHINGVWFNYKTMTDTVKIPISDSLNHIKFTFPFEGAITSQFGSRHGFWHFGVDIRLQVGDTVKCAADGIVRVIENDRYGYGKVVVVRHRDGLETLYGHLSRTLVEGNQQIKSGDPIGLGGNTGRSTGSHLHFEMRYCGEPFDPNVLINFNNYSILSDTLSISKANFDYLTDVRKTVYHTVHKGETLGRLAKRYGTTIKKICALNGISKRTTLRVGRKLIIRKFEDQTPRIDKKNLANRMFEPVISETDISQKL
jgi:LysM repeat protein